MSKRTSILENNYTAFPNELIRNRNDFMTRNEQALMIFLWDRLYGYEYPKSEISYSIIIKDCRLISKNRNSINKTIKELERKGLLKVYRKYEKVNKYFIGEKQYRVIQWYGKNFKGWKQREEIELPPELIDNNETETSENQEKTLFEELAEYELKLKTNKVRSGWIDSFGNPVETLPIEKRKLETLTNDEFIELFPDINTTCLGLCRNQTVEEFKITAEQIRARLKSNSEKEKQKEAEIDELAENEMEDIWNQI
jgi:hypothetical protein